MSIKREIKAVLQNGGDCKVSDIACISRWFEDALGHKVDKLQISFRYTIGIAGGKTYTIDERDIDDVIDAIAALHKTFLIECADAYAQNLKNGLRR